MRLIRAYDTLSIQTTLLNTNVIPKSFVKIDWTKIKAKILDKHYDLSIVFVGRKKSKKLNWLYRKKDYEPDVLSFIVSEAQGEIFINPYIAKTKARTFDMTYEKYLYFLVIHGMLHLNGMSHGAKMEKAEQKYLRDFQNKWVRVLQLE